MLNNGGAAPKPGERRYKICVICVKLKRMHSASSAVVQYIYR
jgi:hypothetical protein